MEVLAPLERTDHADLLAGAHRPARHRWPDVAVDRDEGGAVVVGVTDLGGPVAVAQRVALPAGGDRPVRDGVHRRALGATEVDAEVLEVCEVARWRGAPGPLREPVAPTEIAVVVVGQACSECGAGGGRSGSNPVG